ncbi:MAG: hypothetical protein RLZZ397_115 [Pseudomonadota bacterium]|jgi:hypothetical protein
MSPTTIQTVATVIFALALIHTFSTKFFEKLAHSRPRHAGIWHLLAEVEIVFGFWAMVLAVTMAFMLGKTQAVEYIDGRNFTEPMFVFAIMVVAGSKPILQFAVMVVQSIVKVLPVPRSMAFYFTCLSIVPLLGSFITEPAAMTLAALMMRDTIFAKASRNLQYATLGALFVNVSIGGTLTPFAAPPVLMVASKWGLDITYMLTMIGWKAAVAVFITSSALTFLYGSELRRMSYSSESPYSGVPMVMVGFHLLMLLGIVVFAHHTPIFMSIFLLFMGVATAYPQFQEKRLILREGLLVGFFLGGLVVLGGMQQWWLQPLLMSMDETAIYFGATALTAITDNAALTYLGSLVEGLTPEFKYALLTGAVTGGGLTIIANAPNPAGASILKGAFRGGVINPLGLFVGALPPTLVAIVCFRFLA